MNFFKNKQNIHTDVSSVDTTTRLLSVLEDEVFNDKGTLS